jgi:hypothetical protein
VGTREVFIGQQAAALAPLDFVVVTVVRDPPGSIELAREEDGGFRIRAASPKRPFGADQAKALSSLGFTQAEDAWASGVLADPAPASALLDRVLDEVFGADETVSVDVDHGSRRPLVEAQQKLEAMRARIAPILAGIMGGPVPVDSDGDFALKLGSVSVFVSPLAVPNMLPVVRVFAITNVGVNLTPELGLFLSRVNFTLLFGRFALDTDHRAVWFSETLLGEAFSDDELRFTVGMVAETADEWDDRIAQSFGGSTPPTLPEAPQDLPAKPGRPSAPDRAGYL